MGGAQGGALTCSNSSVMVLGSSCLWNHIMYLVWNRHDCFFRALAARYCAFVPWRRKGGTRGQGAPTLVEAGGTGPQADPGARRRLRWGRTVCLLRGWGMEPTTSGQRV